MKLHKLIQRASAAAVASAMILSVTLPTLAAAPDGTGNAAVADMVSLTNGTAALSEEDEGRDTGITVNGQSVLVNSTVVDNIPDSVYRRHGCQHPDDPAGSCRQSDDQCPHRCGRC